MNQGRRRIPRGVSSAPDRKGWVRVKGIESWESWTFYVRTELVDGVPRLVGVRIEPNDDAPLADIVISRRRAESLPVAELAFYGLHDFGTGPTLMDTHMATAGQRRKRPRGGSDEFSEYVADVFRAARAGGESGQKAVADACASPDGRAISHRRAEDYIREARERGLLEPAKPRNFKRKGTK